MIPGSANPLLLATTAGAGGYEIERSLRFNTADSAHLSRTPSVAGNRKTWTWAGWVKKSQVTSGGDFFFIDGSSTPGEYFICNWYSEGLAITDYQYYYFRLADVNYYLRDPSAWYHIVIALDSTAATEASRLSVYINGNLISSAATKPTAVALNQEFGVNRASLHQIGRFNGYLADIHFIDGQALDPSSFGEFDTNGVWQPIAYAGTYGTNGFHLPFSDNSTAAALGTDTSGNSNTWTVNNISVTAGAGNDSLVDSPTNYGTDTGAGGEVRGNYCTLNPLAISNAGTVNWTLTNGNLDAGDPADCYGVIPGTIGVLSGKYYWELTFAGGSIGSTDYWGIERCDNTRTTRFPGNYENAYWFRADGNKVSGTGSASSYGSSFVLTDKAGIAFDADNGTLTFYKNGTSLGTAFTGIDTSQLWRLVIGNTSNTTSIITWTLNAGQRPFAYTAPSGFKALCTTNLAEPTIADGSTAMDVVTYTGNGSTQTISGLGFSPDFVWIKQRNAARSHRLFDTIRGAGDALFSDLTSAAQTESNALTAFNSDGFTLGDALAVNVSPNTYVAWTWDAGSSTVTNDAGSITSQVRANASAGFSVVTWIGTGANATVGHGLGVAPGMVIVKRRDTTGNWQVRHTSIAAANSIQLNLTAAAALATTVWNSTVPTSTVFSIGTDTTVNASGGTYVAYCFAPVAGYSSFGSYTGNGSADGPFVYTGFRPKFLLVKLSSGSIDDWFIQDTTRSPYNVSVNSLSPNNPNVESSGTFNSVDILSNGFKPRDTNQNFNGSGYTYIYAAFAEHPFATSRAR
jgi:hypothetical protein